MNSFKKSLEIILNENNTEIKKLEKELQTVTKQIEKERRNNLTSKSSDEQRLKPLLTQLHKLKVQYEDELRGDDWLDWKEKVKKIVPGGLRSNKKL